MAHALGFVALLQCRQPHSGSKARWLEADLSVECRDDTGALNSTYRTYLVLTIVLMATYVYFLPVAILAGLFLAKRLGHDFKKVSLG